MDPNRFRLTAALFLAATGLLLTAVAESENQVTTCVDRRDLHLIVLRLDCDHAVISVKDTVYRCSNSWVCPEVKFDPWLANTNDDREGAVDKLKTRCDGEKSCELLLSDFLTDYPCVGANVFVQTTFTCVEAMTVVACDMSTAHLDSETVVACQGSTAHLDCGLGRAIAIYGAAYGRRDPTTCAYETNRDYWQKNLDCMQPATALVAQRCDGQSSCSVRASGAMFTNPCPGTYKYLEISYGCKRPDSVARVTTCDDNVGQVHHLYCNHGVINVTDSVYGRSNSWDCSEGRSDQQLADTHCNHPDATEFVKRRCDGMTSCQLLLSDFRTPDPCFGTAKYLQTNFTCVEAQTVVACQGTVAHLDCGSGHVIAIYGAAYGRRDQTTCASGIAALYLRNVVCMQPATALVAQMCDGQSSCSVRASNAVFTDPCFGIYKYLEISYACKPPEAHD